MLKSVLKYQMPDVSSLRPLTTVVLNEHLARLKAEIAKTGSVVYALNSSFICIYVEGLFSMELLGAERY